MKKSESKEVATKSTAGTMAAFDPSALATGIAKSKEIAPPGGDAADIVKVTTDGQVVRGMDKEIVEPDEEWRVSPANIYQGFICWKDGKPVDRKSRSLVELATHDAYKIEDLPDHGPYTSEMDGWGAETAMGMIAVEDGLQAVFPTTSLGGRQAIQRVIDAIGKQYDDDPEHLVPVLTITADSYFNKKFRKDIYFPVFDIVRWENNEGGVAEEAA